MIKFLMMMFVAMMPFSASAQTYPPLIAAIDPADMISITDATSADALRASLINQVYSGDGLSAPNAATLTTTYPLPAGYPNLDRLERWDVETSRGFSAVLIRWVPAVYNSLSSALIIHGGHGQWATNSPFNSNVIYFVASGYEVWTVDMVLSGMNTPPTIVADPVVGNVEVRHHNDMQALHTPNFNPLRLFIEPVTVIVDDLTSRGLTNIAMIGLSGGGWTTIVAAAFDPRILVSYAVAGSAPIYTRSWGPPHSTLGDWEQSAIPALGVSYLDLYILASYGTGRHLTNIHNVYDDVGFGGNIAMHYDAAVSGVVTTIGGEYNTFLDYIADGHTISWKADNYIRVDIATRFY